jgi:gliding motility-associated-like protein
MRKLLFSLLLLLPALSFAQLPTSGLVAWYPFCGNTNDYTGNGYNLNDSGAVLTTDRFGSSNCAYHFDGLSNVMYIHSLLPLPYNNFTYSCWMLADTVQDGVIVYNGNSNTNGTGIVYDAGSATPGYNITMLAGGVCFCMSVFAPLHQWHHAVLRCSSGTFNLFIDTTLVSTSSAAYISPSGIFAVGMDYTDGTNAFIGKIDDIAVYNRALSDTEIRQLYHYQPPCTTVVDHSCNTITMPDSLSFCADTSIILPATVSGSDTVISTTWSPPTGISDTTILNPTLTVSAPGWHYLTARSLIPGNLVVNGDFSAGNTGFTSGYPYGSGPGSLAGGVYAISTDPIHENIYAASIHDHTTGSGNMMAVNGASTPVDVWCETIAVTPNTYYNFSAWFANWSSDTTDNLPLIQFEINGTLIGSLFSFPHPDGLWALYSTMWYSGSNTSITLCINDQQTAYVGNDFAIDDISFQQVCTVKDSIYIAIATKDTTYTHSDTTFCINSQEPVFIIDAPAGYTSYLWNTGSAATSIQVGPGIYHVYAYKGCNVRIDTIHVSVINAPQVYLGADTILCTGQNIVLGSPEAGGASYLWNTGSTDSSITVTDSGTYILTVSISGCSTSDTISISQLTKPSVNLGRDTALCTGEAITLSVPTTPALWSNGTTGQSITVSDAGTYWVTETNYCGATTDSIKIDVGLCNIWFPSAFSPDGDGHNDIIRVVGNLQFYRDFSLSIYNRWGERVFNTTNIYQGWDGKLNGVPQDMNTYFYMINYTLEGQKHLMKGDFELIR